MTQEQKIELWEKSKAVPIYNMRSQYGGYQPAFEFPSGGWLPFAKIKERFRKKHPSPMTP
jgi:hypothetical protein